MSSPRHWTRHDDPQGITWLWLDRADSNSNTLGSEVLAELDTLLAALHRRVPRGVVIASRKTNGFVFGADIREFRELGDESHAYAQVRRGQAVINRLAALPCPTVAMINGYALGGGLELALACRYRLCAESDSATLGLPEVKLGLHPGFGGTVRSVALLGVPAAMDLILTGRSLRPRKARALGLVDRVVAADELEDAARALVQRPPRPRRAPWFLRLLNLPGVRSLVAAQLRRQVARQAREAHYPAPYAAIRLWQRIGGSGRDSAYEAEARSIARLFATDTARNLVRVFFLQERMKALGKGNPREFARVHVVGAGVMGGDIAAWCARRGLEVTLQDRDADTVERGLQRVRAELGKRMDSSRLDELMSRLTADADGAGADDADVVIEAIFEDLDAKRTLFTALEKRVRGDAVLASNTSSIRLESIAEGLADPARLVGLHFFNPVARLPLVEVIRSGHSAEQAVADALAFTGRIGKLPLPCASQPGFLVNRILAPYLNEAFRLHREGLPLQTIDAAARDFGMPMGPLELADSVGLDVALQVATILGEAFGRPVPEGLKDLVDAGKLGRKSGEGFYRYADGRPVRDGRAPDHDAPDDLQDRLMLPLVNEAVACLADGVVEDEDLLDAGVIFGTGFAPFRGGPLRYARDRGLKDVHQRLQILAQRHGDRFEPHPHWSGLVRHGERPAA